MTKAAISKVDRRIDKTRRALSDALVALILAQGWDAITVQGLCNQANVGRSTFYVHFADKEELLLSGFASLRQGLRARHPVPRAKTERPLGFTLALMEHAQENSRLFRALVGKRSGQVVQKHFVQLVTELVREDLASVAPPGKQLDATVRYVSGALVELMTWWLDSRGVSVGELEEYFHRLTAPVLVAAAGKQSW